MKTEVIDSNLKALSILVLPLIASLFPSFVAVRVLFMVFIDGFDSIMEENKSIGEVIKKRVRIYEIERWAK